MKSSAHPFPGTLTAAGTLAAAVLQPVFSGLQAANDNDEPEPPPAVAAPIPHIGPSALFDASWIFHPVFSAAAA
jgi:hypothetical protein